MVDIAAVYSAVVCIAADNGRELQSSIILQIFLRTTVSAVATTTDGCHCRVYHNRQLSFPCLPCPPQPTAVIAVSTTIDSCHFRVYRVYHNRQLSLPCLPQSTAVIAVSAVSTTIDSCHCRVCCVYHNRQLSLPCLLCLPQSTAVIAPVHRSGDRAVPDPGELVVVAVRP